MNGINKLNSMRRNILQTIPKDSLENLQQFIQSFHIFLPSSSFFFKRKRLKWSAI